MFFKCFDCGETHWENIAVVIALVFMATAFIGWYPLAGLGFVIFMACVGAGAGRHEM